MILPIFPTLNNFSLDSASVVSVSTARGLAAEELGGLIDSSVNKEGLAKLLMRFCDSLSIFP